VRDAYRLLTNMDVPDVVATSHLIWHKQVPLKVYVLALRLFRNRLPTKDNLVTCNIIQQDVQFCVTGCGELESAQHLFLFCPIFAPLWTSIRSWIGISFADRNLLQDHFL
jgi:hypothetical protein